MRTPSIPQWNAVGVIPPVNLVNATAADRSPYVVSVVDLVLRFATSDDRRRVLEGFLRYRKRLHAAGLTDGFQWLNGSFMENVEVIEGRSPNDLDVVTFFQLPAGTDEPGLNRRDPIAFPLTRAERGGCKSDFSVDPYFINLGSPPDRLVRSSAYWYSVWSHRRDATWKGYLQIDLNPAEDGAATSQLPFLSTVEGEP